MGIGSITHRSFLWAEVFKWTTISHLTTLGSIGKNKRKLLSRVKISIPTKNLWLCPLFQSIYHKMHHSRVVCTLTGHADIESCETAIEGARRSSLSFLWRGLRQWLLNSFNSVGTFITQHRASSLQGPSFLLPNRSRILVIKPCNQCTEARQTFLLTWIVKDVRHRQHLAEINAGLHCDT